MPPRKSRPAESSSRAGNVSLSSTVGAPTPARRRNMPADYSIASTLASSTPAASKKRGRPSSKTALTTPAMRALTSADTSGASTSYASASAAPRARGRPKSILSTPGSRTLASPPNSVSFSDQSGRRAGGAKRKAADDASVSSAQRRGRPASGGGKAKQAALGLPKSRPSQTAAARHTRPDPELDPDSGSDVSLLEDDDSATSASETDPSRSDDEQSAPSSSDETRTRTRKRNRWPTEKERQRKWRRLSVEERECVTSESGLIWRTAIPLLNSMPKNIRSLVADSLTRALNRIDAKLESGLVPPLARLPPGNTTAAARRDLASSMLAWRIEDEGAALLRTESTQQVDPMQLGMNADISTLEHMLLPEAEHIVQLSKTLAHQSEHLETATARIARLKRDRRLVKTAGNEEYPANLEAHELLSVANHNPAIDPNLASFLRLSHSV